ncbi:UNVERIFIED_CONTAM: hypothetical protein PYX00_009205 [Menopon gallinae]|uniref:Uncharacterized protein n=1 Tax=Menopon gallinae TaxID=328185 RepID=A0AAW2HAD5_9NEOP
MNHSFWLIVIFVATLVCNTNSRPQNERAKNYYRVHDSLKDQEQANTNRYDESTFIWGREREVIADAKYRTKRDADPVTFVRIDIPYNRTRNGLIRSIVESNPVNNDGEKEGGEEEEVHYVPVSVSSKSDSKKKWPSQTGVASLDDLYLYNTYTSSVNDKIKPSGSPSQVVPYISNKKPAIIIIEELTTKRPYFEKPAYPADSFTYTPIEVITYRPEPTRPSFFGTSFPSYTTTMRPLYPSVIYPPPAVTRPPSTPKPKPACPSLTISATNTVINNNKEGCNDIKINIESTVINGASQSAGSATQTGVQNDMYNPITVAPGIGVNRPEDDTMQFFGPDFGDFFGSMFSTFTGLTLINPFSLTFLSTLFSPVMAVLAGGVGIAALILPCAFFSGRGRAHGRSALLRNRSENSQKYVHEVSRDKRYLHRTTRSVLSLPYKGHIASGRGRRKFCLSYCLSRKRRGSRSYNCDSCSDAPPTAQPVAVDTPKPETVTKTLPNIEAIAVVARASSDRPAPLTAETVPDVVGQMVESDIRTPPKLKEIIQGKISNEGRRREEEIPTESGMVVDRIEANGRFELPDASERASSFPYVMTEGKGSNPKKKDEDMGVKGIAVPVLMDETEPESPAPPKKLQKIPEVMKPVKDDKKKANPKPMHNPTTTPSSGLSTWILLSDNRDITTPSPKKNNKKETSAKPDDKKTVATTKKPTKMQTTTVKPMRTDAPKTTLVTKKGVVTPKPEIRRTENDNENMSALEAMVKNQKKNTQTTRIDDSTLTTKLSQQKKPTTVKPNRINDRMDVAETKGPDGDLVEARRPSTIPPMLPIATQNPTTVGLPDQQGTNPTTTDPSVESTTKKKKNGTKKKKKNKNRRRKPVNGTTTQIEQKNVSKNPKEPPVGAQLYNFLSREIMPTVGLGLVGVLVTAGLAGLLGYNPFVSGNLPVRRTYELHHGYSPNNYYSYNSEYNDGGQSEEALFREVLSGMPEGSRYGLSNTENSYPESQIYNSQDQVYDAMKSQTDKKYQSNDGTGQYQYPDAKNEEETSNYDGSYSQDYSNTYATAYDSPDMLKTRDNSNKYPMYDREVSASYVYPETSTAEKSSRLNEEYDAAGNYPDSSRYGSDKLSSKYSKTKTDTIERQPEALYRVAGDYDHSYRGESTVQGISSQNSWHRMGSALDYTRYSHLEPGPRSLNFTKEELANAAKKRTKRAAESVIQRIARKQESGNAEKDVENEIDFEDSVEDMKNQFPESTTERMETTVPPLSEDSSNATTEPEYDVIETNPITYNFLDVLKRLAQYKLKIGLSFLRSTTDAFSRYLDVIQRRVDESITNTTLVYRIRRNPDVHTRSKRSAETKKRNKKQSKRKGDKKKEFLKKN